MKQEFSFKRQIWHRFKKNKAAMIGLTMIIFALLLSVFGYLVAPDGTPNADLQTIEIQAKKPGYTQLYLKIPGKKNNNTSWFAQLLSGKPVADRYLPITEYTLHGDSL